MARTSPILRIADAAPELVRRLTLIVGGVAALIARRVLRDPRFFKLTGPLWSWLNRTVQRFGRVRMVPAAPVAAPRPQRVRTVPVDRVRLPSGRGWLVKALGWEAAGYGSQLDALLHEPEMVALLETVPAVGRLLRPLARMLGVTVGPVVVQAVAAVMRKVRPRKPRAKRMRPWSPGPIRPPWRPDRIPGSGDGG